MKIFHVEYSSMAGTYEAIIVAYSKSGAIKIFAKAFEDDVSEEHSTAFELGKTTTVVAKPKVIMYKYPQPD